MEPLESMDTEGPTVFVIGDLLAGGHISDEKAITVSEI
jgi:hypothetical protein